MAGRHALGGERNQKPIMKETALALGNGIQQHLGWVSSRAEKPLRSKLKSTHPNPEAAVRFWPSANSWYSSPPRVTS